MKIIDVGLTLQNVTDESSSTTNNILIGDLGTATAPLHISGSDSAITTDSILVQDSSGNSIFEVLNKGVLNITYPSKTSTLVIADGNVATTIGTNSVIIGKDATNSSTFTGNFHTIIGYGAGGKNDRDLGDNYLTAVGYGAAYSASGVDVTSIGSYSGYQTYGDQSQYFGTYAGYQSILSKSTIVGRSAGFQSAGTENVYLGNQSGLTGVNGSLSSQNVFIGYDAGNGPTDGILRNIFIGHAVAKNATIGSNNTIIGANLQNASSENLSDTVILGSYNNERLRIKSTGQFLFNGYTATTDFPGTAVGVLGFDSSGNILTIATSSGAIDGSGTTNYVTKWSDADTLTDSQIFDNSTNVGIGTTSPSEKLHVNGNILFSTDGSENTLISNKVASGTTGANIFIGGGGQNINGTTGGQSSFNVSLGSGSLESNTTGGSNTAVGYLALQDNATGGSNTAIGYFALNSNISGYYNTALGFDSLRFNTGGSNTSVGYQSLRNNTSGGENIAIGYEAGITSTTNNSSIYIGYGADASAATGITNEIAIGSGSLGNGSNTFTYGNDSITKHIFTAGNVGIGLTTPTEALHVSGNILFDTNGDSTLISNFRGTSGGTTSTGANIFIGGGGQSASPYNNNIDATSVNYGSYNTSLGSGSLESLGGGFDNVAVGYQSLYSNDDGGRNIAIGYQSLDKNTYSDDNIAIGYQAGSGSLNAYRSVFIGNNTKSDSPSSFRQNEIVIGWSAVGNGNNTFTYGNSSISKHHFTSGQLQLESYLTSTSYPGSEIGLLGFDNVGNVVTIATQSNAVDGTGVANKLAVWSDTDTLTNYTDLHWDSSISGLGIGTSDISGSLHIKGKSTDSSTTSFTIADSAGAEYFFIKNNQVAKFTGEFVIGGTASPSRRLHVVGSTNDGTSNVFSFHNSDDTQRMYFNGAGRLFIESSNDLPVLFSRPNQAGVVDFQNNTSEGAIGYYGNATRYWSTGVNQLDVDDFEWAVGSGSGTFDTTDKIISAKMNGGVRFDQYGSGTYTGTLTKYLGVDTNGNIIEESGSATPSEAFYAFDTTGGQSIGGTATVLNIDTEEFNSSGTIFSLASDVITINADIRGCFSFYAAFQTVSTTRTTVQTKLQESTNGGSTWNDVPGAVAYSYVRQGTSNDDSTGGAAVIVREVTSGYKYRLVATNFAGTVNTVPDATGITIFDLKGGRQGPSGSAAITEDRGTFSGTTDTNGQLTFNHSLGSTPTVVIVTQDMVGTDADVANVVSKTSTQVTIESSRRTSTSISGYYIVS